MNPGTIGYVWTGEFDLNTLRVDGKIFESGKKKLRIQKYPDTCGQGLSFFDLFDKNRMQHSLRRRQSKPPVYREFCDTSGYNAG